MGIELTLFALPSNCLAAEKTLYDHGNGDLLQTINFLINDIRAGRPGSNNVEAWENDKYYSDGDVVILKETFNDLKQNPNLFFVYYYDGARGHDHWVYLLELLAGDAEINLPRAAAFGSQGTPDAAKATQGAPIGWSNVEQVQRIANFLDKVDFDEITSRFKGFPQDRHFYKRRSDDAHTHLYSTIRDIKRFYSRAANQELIVVSILD